MTFGKRMPGLEIDSMKEINEFFMFLIFPSSKWDIFFGELNV
jgi:hypothetical protein